ncbi:cytidine/deoxycytidylate deaminase-like protein [Trinickia symbiotica]|uniref:CMP deaminase n=1 Tax=Trinickia symbiotica TaxID=863227 RepID=A0A2N7WKH3_9BURK|nr:anti-phage dCTP deaminase [Trinickia symbiotica]PMS29893.1 CMP deaminase [Trinickia symbiotica]PPK41082.1 cytidine/deoxycytidylate deaminase-like protein [Trinickia symbiotica]
MTGSTAKVTDMPGAHARPQVDSTSEANASLTPELVIAQCGPIGSPLHEASEQIENALSAFGYRTERLRLSDFIRLNAQPGELNDATRFDQIKSLIAAGDRLRLTFGKDILAKLAIAKIGGDRRKKFGEFQDIANEAQTDTTKQIKVQRVCHVIDSIKNSSELDLLRLIYGSALFAIGVFSPLEIRRKNLEQPGALRPEETNELIDTDSGEEFDHGQSVRDTFPKCDFFLRIDHPAVGPTEAAAVAQLVEKLRRFFNLIFRTSIETPTPEENAMYSAASAARNSACLSRQVGAAVTTSAGELLSVGWNDVPRSGGGVYGKPSIASTMTFTGSNGTDERCFAQRGGKCYNDEEKSVIAAKLVETLASAGLLAKSDQDKAVSIVLNDSRVKDLIEFSRAVHAEMHAILGASRVAGERVIGGKLYVTTYPCHSCARHIVAAGVSEVHYIEPYRKSLATRLHKDALTESVGANDAVRLLQFDGVAPRRFIDLFEAGNRKKGGVLNLTGRHQATPSTHVSLRAIPRLEEVVVAEIESKQLKFPGLLRNEETDGQAPHSPTAA